MKRTTPKKRTKTKTKPKNWPPKKGKPTEEVLAVRELVSLLHTMERRLQQVQADIDDLQKDRDKGMQLLRDWRKKDFFYCEQLNKLARSFNAWRLHNKINSEVPQPENLNPLKVFDRIETSTGKQTDGKAN